MHLRTLGHPALRDADDAPVAGLRRKDVALLVYLCVDGSRAHSRGRLAALLWGESPEERARHSLTQALGRLARRLEPGVLVADKESVRWTGGLDCDAETLLRGELRPEAVDDAFSLYPTHFLEGFDAGAGAEDFADWVDRRRAELRNAALRLLERAGEHAEAEGAWARALRLGERAVEIDPVGEQGHRRVMRALAARGERNAALRHYLAFERWLADEVGGDPDPDTRALANLLRAPDPPPRRPHPATEPPAAPDPSSSAPVPPPPPPTPEPPTPERAADPARDAGSEAQTAASSTSDGGSEPHAAPEWDSESESRPASTAAREDEEGMDEGRTAGLPRPAEKPRNHRRMTLLLAALAAAMIALASVTLRERGEAGASAPERPPAHGENVRLHGTRRIFLAFAETLYAYPDPATLRVCTGEHPQVVREVRALPPWPRRKLPSVHAHPWIGGMAPVVSDHPADKTAFVAVGCILPGVPDPPTLDSIFGPGALQRLHEVPDETLRRMPRAHIARGHPLREAGTLIRDDMGRIRWITYHGGALEVEDAGLLATHCRDSAEVIPVREEEFAYYQPYGQLERGTAACPV